MKKIFILSLLVCIWSPLTFAFSSNDEGLVQEFTVGETWINLKTTHMNNNEGCVDNSWFRLDIESDAKAMYVSIITAKSAGQLIHFDLDGCTEIEGYPKIVSVYVN